MNRREYLLTKLVEECLEVAQRATKAMCFGAEEIEPGQNDNNITRLNGEWNDLLAVVELLAEQADIELYRITSLVVAKRAKIQKFMAYSQERLCLEDDSEEALTASYKAWCEREGIERIDADELIQETNLTLQQRRYLTSFLIRWELMIERKTA